MRASLSKVYQDVTVTQKRSRALAISFEVSLQEWIEASQQAYYLDMIQTLSELLVKWYRHAQYLIDQA